MLALFAAAAWLPGTVTALRGGGTALPALGPGSATATATAPGAPAPAGLAPAASPPDIGREPLPVPRDIPAHAPGPVAAVKDYFFTLSCAAVVPEGMPAMGCGEAAFPRAYAYLDGGWQARLPFAKFVASFAGVLHTDLLLALDAGPVAGSPNERRVFAEVRRIEQVGPRQVVTFSSGVFTVAAGRTGWQLVEGALRPEDLAALAYAGQDVARGDPLSVARVAAGLPPDSGAPATLRAQSGPTATVQVQLPGGVTVTAHLVRLVDGTWQSLYTERG